MTQTHASLLNPPDRGSHRGPKKTNCWCEVAYAGTTVHGGIEWIVYCCRWCRTLIYTVGGHQHDRNYEEGVPR
jgi:hypothetical protein